MWKPFSRNSTRSMVIWRSVQSREVTGAFTLASVLAQHSTTVLRMAYTLHLLCRDSPHSAQNGLHTPPSLSRFSSQCSEWPTHSTFSVEMLLTVLRMAYTLHLLCRDAPHSAQNGLHTPPSVSRFFTSQCSGLHTLPSLSRFSSSQCVKRPAHSTFSVEILLTVLRRSTHSVFSVKILLLTVLRTVHTLHLLCQDSPHSAQNSLHRSPL